MIKESNQEENITIVNSYAPNTGAPQYIRQTLTDIKGETDNNAIIVGDFNARVQLQQPGIQPEGVSGVGKKLRQPLIFLGLPVYFKLMILFYTSTKVLGQRFDIFSSH